MSQGGKSNFPNENMLKQEKEYFEQNKMIALNVVISQRLVDDIENVLPESRLGFDGILAYLAEQGFEKGDLSPLYK